MRFPIALALLTAAATGCGGGEDAVWLMIVGDEEVTENSMSCDANFLDADCPEDADPDPGDWTITQDFDESDGAFFAQIIDGPGGQKLLVIGDEVYIGEKDGGVWSFSWENFEESESTQSHSTGYSFTSTVDNRSQTTIELDISGGEATGRLLVNATESERVEESDTWSGDETGFYRGQIADEAPVFLDGFMDNYSDESECTSSTCFVAATVDMTYEIELTGIRTGESGDAFDGVRDAGQSSGY